MAEKVTIKNLDKLHAIFEQSPRKLIESVSTAINKSVLTIESNAKREAPVARQGGGSLRQSIRSGMLGIATGMVEVGVKYGPFVEYGTRPHQIRAKNAKVLARRNTGGGYTVFGPVVNHPGTKANPFLKRAVEKSQPQIDNFFEEAAQKALT